MAMFREHISVGAIVAIVCVTLAYFYALIVDPFLLMVLFLTSTAASFLPDLDSDSGLPFYFVFGTFTMACTGAMLYYTLLQKPEEWYVLIGLPLATMVVVWFVVGKVFKHLTHHRGIFHSIPATLIAGCLAFLLGERMGESVTVSTTFALSVALGYLSHLVLDEFHSGVNLEGSPLSPKRSLGTALKLFSDSRIVNIATYTLLIFLGYQFVGSGGLEVLSSLASSVIIQ